MRFTVNDIVSSTGGKLLSQASDEEVKGFSIDTRTIEPGEFFITVKGSNFDGYDFIDEAVEKGARGIIVDRLLDDNIKEKIDHIILVKDTVLAMGDMARVIRKSSNIPFICITGSNGKTSVKDMIAHVLSDKYKVLKSKKSYNNLIGLSLTLFDLDPSHDIAVIELGTNFPGEIAALADIAGPTAAVITNIGDTHLEFFGNRDCVFSEKISLLGFLPDDGIAFLNGDDAFLGKAGIRKSTVKFYGTFAGSEYLISGISRKKHGFSFSLNGRGFFLPLEGVHNVNNAAAAIAVAEYFDIDPRHLRKRLEEVSLPEMRLEKINIDGFTFINDSYNANPSSFECALDVLMENNDGEVKGVVSGDMMELGERSRDFHRCLGKSIASRGVDFLVVLGGEAKEIATGAIEGGMQENRVLLGETHEDAAEMVRHMAGPGTVVLLKGSRMSRMEEVLKCFTISCTR